MKQVLEGLWPLLPIPFTKTAFVVTFTMNALGWRLNGTILDYHEGVDDIEFGQLVAVGDASERLEEDPLRILRAVRFASRYGLEIDDDLGGAIETNLPQLLTLSPERIRRELDYHS